MTADAKIGLLVGLVFIGVIAFLINGLPNLINKDAGQGIIPVQATPGDSMVIEYEALRAVNGNSTTPVDLPVRETAPPSGEKIVPLPGRDTPPVVAAEQTSVAAVDTASAARALTYIVKPGDSLAAIAKKVYGDVVGNKVDVVDKLFQANKAILKSPDDILVGQEILVPPADELFKEVRPAPGTASAAAADNPAPGFFERVISPFTAKDAPKETPKPAESKPARREYTVQENDSLWDIAADQLGSGARYHEIVKLNKDVIKNENAIPAGVKLKLPPK